MGELIEDRVTALTSRRLRWNRDDPRQLPLGGVRLECELGARVDDEALLVGKRQLLERLARYGLPAMPLVRPLRTEGPLATLIVAYLNSTP